MSDDHTQTTLSPEGERRRDAMLSELKGAVRARRRRRRAVQGALAAAPLLLLTAAVLLIARTPSTPDPASLGDPIVSAPAPTESAPQLTHVAFSTVDDDELLDLLHSAGYDAGIARLGPRVIVTGLGETGSDDTPPETGEPGADAETQDGSADPRRSV